MKLRQLIGPGMVFLVAATGLAAQQADSIASTNNPPAASQPVPRLIMFSGTVKDPTGKPLTGPEELNFAIYKEQTDAAPLWQETQTLNVDEQGHYSVLLGAMQPEGLPTELFTTGEAHWLGVSAGKVPEQPRVLLVSVPYALKAGDAETLGGKPASAYALAQPPGASTSAGATASGGAASSELAAPGKPKSGLNPNVAGTGTLNYIPRWTNSAGTLGNSVIFQSGNNVGFGTTTPGYRLDVVGGSARVTNPSGTAQLVVSGSASSGRLGQDAAGFFFSSDTNGGAVRFLTNNGSLHEWMRVTSAGNVGVGTATPAQKLDVSGNLKITGAGNAIIFPDGTVQSTAGSGSGGGTVTAVTAGTGLAGGGTGGNVTLSLANSSCTAGSALTGLPLTCQPFATLGSNLFVGDQGITGKLTASGSTSELDSAILRVTQNGKSSANWTFGNYPTAAIRGDSTTPSGAAFGVVGTAVTNDAVGVAGFNTAGAGVVGYAVGTSGIAGTAGWCEQTTADCMGVVSFLRMQGKLFEGRVAVDATDDTGITKFLVDGSGNVRANAYLDLAGNPIPAGPATDLNCAGCVSSSEVDFNYAGSSSKGGAATSAVAADTATNALSLGGATASSYARVDAGNTFSSTTTFSGEVTFGAGGISHDGAGLKHSRGVLILPAGSTGTTQLSWSTAFADASYTATCQAQDPNSTGTGLKVIRIRSFTASSITVDVANDSGSDRTGSLHCIAIHD